MIRLAFAVLFGLLSAACYLTAYAGLERLAVREGAAAKQDAAVKAERQRKLNRWIDEQSTTLARWQQ